MKSLVYWYFIGINLLACAVYGIDKQLAKKRKWRVSERNLLFLAALGGALGALFAMSLFRHKTKHKKFTVTVPLLLAVQLALLAWYSLI